MGSGLSRVFRQRTDLEFIRDESAEAECLLLRIPEQRQVDPTQFPIARWFQMQLKRRGVELQLIVGDHNRSAAIVDLSLAGCGKSSISREFVHCG